MAAPTAAPPSGFARSSYPARVAGLALGALTIAAVFRENGASLWVWAWLVAHGLVWPHIAYLWVRSARDSEKAENRNRLIDHFAGGMWIAGMQFNAVPSVLMLALMSMDSIVGGGVRACLRGVLCHVLGVGLGVLVFGWHWQPYSSMLEIVACIPLMLIHPLVVGYMTWRALGKLRKRRAEMQKLSQLDSLTGLANRRRFFDEVQALCAQGNKDGATPRRFAVGVFDLDGFKPVNDLYGHVVGDQLLAQVAQRMQPMCDENVLLTRLGGDEFAFVFTGDDLDEAQLLTHGALFCSALRTPFVLPDVKVQVSASMGVAIYPDMATSAANLYEYADYALYQAKRSNRGAVSLFLSSHRDRMQRDMAIEQALRSIDFGQELALHFQPIVSINNEGRTAGFEALARWSSPTLGMVSPGHFIPIAERAGLIQPITRTLLLKALSAMAHWPDDVWLSFNLSSNDVGSQANVDQIIELIRQSGISPRRIDLEITETMIMHDIKQAHMAIDQLAKLGCGVTLDDFGTGYSSLTQLHTLPLTKIKIDRSFVTNLDKNPVSRKIVKSLLALSRDMEIGCVIEGVETREEEAEIQQLGGALLQGFLFSRPLPEYQVPAWLAR